MSVTLVALLFAIAAFLAVYAAFTPLRDLPRNDPLDTDDPAAAANASGGSMFDRLVMPVVRNFLPQSPLGALARSRESTKIKELLIRSGNPWNITAEEFFGIRVVSAAAVAVVLLLLTLSGTLTVMPPWAALLVGIGFGAYLPQLLLNAQKGKRQKQARRGLPEALDLLRITMNSGKTFPVALAQVHGRMPSGVIRDELGRVVADLQTGKSQRQALLDFARRAPSDDVEAFCRAIIQAEEQGSDVTETLSAQAESARAAYENMIEVKGNKLPTTLYVPILFLMLPALFIAILAPAISNISGAF